MSGETDRDRNGERSAALGGSWNLLFGEQNVGTCRERAEATGAGRPRWDSFPIQSSLRSTPHRRQMAPCLTKCSVSYRNVPGRELLGRHSLSLKTTAGEATPIQT
ncbi:uncharacterized [Tachysurus ichikawai]